VCGAVFVEPLERGDDHVGGVAGGEGGFGCVAELGPGVGAGPGAGLVAGLSLGPKSSDDEVAKLAETAVRIAKAIHDAAVKSVQFR